MKRSRFKLKLAMVICCVFALVIILINLFHTYCFESSVLRYKLLSEYKIESDKVFEKKVVLFWTKFFDVKHWGMKKETYYPEDLKMINCPETNCVFTHHKNLLDHSHNYDAIVFHGAESWNFLDLPQTRKSSQIFIMASMEYVCYESQNEFI
jgi:hypothetical protein